MRAQVGLPIWSSTMRSSVLVLAHSKTLLTNPPVRLLYTQLVRKVRVFSASAAASSPASLVLPYTFNGLGVSVSIYGLPSVPSSTSAEERGMSDETRCL